MAAPERKKAPQVDLRLAVAVEIAWATGRRINAIRTLSADAYADGWVQFPGATDKARRSGKAYLTDSARIAVEMLLQTPAVQASGLMFPAGDLGEPNPKRSAVSDVALTRWLHKAEVLAEVEKIEGRAFHAIKRRFATATEASTAASKQSGTRKDTLQSKYEQDDEAPKIELAKRLERLRRA